MSYFSQQTRKSPFQANLSSPSPCRYNPNKLSKPACAQVPFGSTSRIDRSKINQNKNNQIGQNGISIQPYNNNYNSIMDQISKMIPKQDKSSSAFVSKTHRFEQKKQQTPGPGSYTSRISSLKENHISRSRIKTKINHSFSNSNIRLKVPSIPSDHLGYRQDNNNTMKKVVLQQQVQPHPGSYDIALNLNKNKGIKWNKNQPKNKTQITPGPGSYQNKIKNPEKVPISSFRSNSKRFNSLQKNNVSEPGPGSYNPLKITKRSHSNNQESNFNSKTTRFQNGNSSNNVGPGQYFNSIKQRVKAKSVTTLNKNIKIDQQRQKLGFKKTIFDQRNQNPGPGQYANTLGINFKLHKQLFRKYNETTLPKQKRAVFQISQLGVTPGPGTYNNLIKGEQKKAKCLSVFKQTNVINLKDYEQQESPSPFQYGNFNNTIENKINKFNNKITLTQNKPFGAAQTRFKHYQKQIMTDRYNKSLPNQETNQSINNELVYDSGIKKVKKLVMTSLKVKVPFGSSSSKIKQQKASQSPAKFYNKEEDWIKKSHNIRSKLK